MSIDFQPDWQSANRWSPDVVMLQNENEQLKEALTVILNNATDTRRYDSGGWAQVYVRQAALNRARQLMGRPLQDEREGLTRP